MRPLLERPLQSRQRSPVPPVLDRLLLLLQCLLCLLFTTGGVYLAVSGSPRHALPLFALAIAVNPFVKLPTPLWLGLVAFGLALA